MSLDVSLVLENACVPGGTGIFVREKGQTKEISREEWDRAFPGKEPLVIQQGESHDVYSANITHNLHSMATAAGIYKYLWEPKEHDVFYADQLIEPLETGLKKLKDDPALYQVHNPSNGWGDYEGLVEFVEEYLAACKKFPMAKISVWR